MATAIKKRGALHSSMGRPSIGSMGSFPVGLKNRILAIRQKHPGWGPTTILAELKVNAQLTEQKLPSRSTIGKYLAEQQLSKRYEPNVSLAVAPCTPAHQPHDLWQIDGQGNQNIQGVGPISMLNIKDVYSTVYVSSFPARMKSMSGHPNTSDYQAAMRLGFMYHGLPARLQSDHASVFYENRSKSPFPTLFCLWLVGLGIEPCYSRVNQPTDQGCVERAHQTIFNQVLEGQTDYKNWTHLFEWCKKRRSMLNEHIPSRATDNQAPLKKHPSALHSGRFYHPMNEGQLIRMEYVFDFLVKGRWYRKVAKNRTICLGGHQYYVTGVRPGEQLQITFDPQTTDLVFQNDKQELLTTLPIKGITAETLMGKLNPITCFPSFQLQLPLDWESQKINTTFSDST